LLKELEAAGYADLNWASALSSQSPEAVQSAIAARTAP
jgi:hypothetical protein